MTSRDFRRRADAVRSIPLETVLTQWGAQRDRRDRHQWRSEHGPLSVSGAKFFNWHRHEGGGGAIDLVMHLSGWDVRAAVGWLEQHLAGHAAAMPSTSACSPRSFTCRGADAEPRPHLPVANLANLQRVRQYLTEQRYLAASVVEPLIEAGKLYADGRGNAVFLMVAGKANHPIGAELRGTGQRIWRGLAPGTCKDAGYFWIGTGGSDKIVLCESAIDAISCFQLHATRLPTNCICISTAGVRPNPPWLHPLLARGYNIYCGFDDDPPGDTASRQMLRQNPAIKRLRPSAHDWNDALKASL